MKPSNQWTRINCLEEASSKKSHRSPSPRKEKLTPKSELRSWVLLWSLSVERERVEPWGWSWWRKASARRSLECDLERLIRALLWMEAAVMLSLLLDRHTAGPGGSRRSTKACWELAKSDRASAPIITRGSPSLSRLTTEGRGGAGPFTLGIS